MRVVFLHMEFQMAISLASTFHHMLDLLKLAECSCQPNRTITLISHDGVNA